MKKTLLVVASFLAVILSSCSAEYVATNPGYGPDVAVGIAPGPNYYWVGREYAWRGGAYVEVPGHWAIPPRQGYTWVAGSWSHGRRGYHWNQGHWR